MTTLKIKKDSVWTPIAGDVSAQNPVNDFISYWTPTPWTPLTLINGYTVVGGQAPKVRRFGDMVQLSGNIAGGSDGADFVAIPTEFQPVAFTHEGIVFCYNNGWTYTSITVGAIARLNRPPGVASQPTNVSLWSVWWYKNKP